MTKKRQIKLSIIDDYTKIILLKNFLNNSFDGVELDSTSSFLFINLKEKTETLEKIYNQLISHLNLKNTSFCVLEQELNMNNQQFELLKLRNFDKLQSNLLLALQKINNIFSSLPEKLNCFKLGTNILNP